MMKKLFKKKRILFIVMIVFLSIITSAVVFGYGGGSNPVQGDILFLDSHQDITHRNQDGQGIQDFVYGGLIQTVGDLEGYYLDLLNATNVSNFSRAMFRQSALSTWVGRLNGNLDYVRSQSPEIYKFENQENFQIYNMHYIREVAWLSGGDAQHESGVVRVSVTRNPEIPVFNYHGTPRPNNELTIRFGARAYAVARTNVTYEITVNGQPFESGYYNTQNLPREFPWIPTQEGTYVFRAIATDDVQRTSEVATFTIVVENDAPPVESEPDPIDEGEPPTVTLSGPSQIKAGDTFCLNANAQSPDGTIDHYSWNLSANGTINGSSGCGLYWMQEGTYPVSVTVTDDRGQTARDSIIIQVLPPTPVANFVVEGTLKENRLVTIKDTSSSPTYFPIDWSKSYYEITALNGANSSAIRYRGSLNNQRDLETLYKQEGQYRIKQFVLNTAGYSNEKVQMITIDQDQKPITNFSMITEVHRDPQNMNKATISIEDMSRSDDNDTIQQRIWRYRYDSNNDGDFNDEEWIVIDDGNNENISFEVSHVGYYLIQLEVVEQFGQPTITEFVTENDYRRNSTDNKPLNESILKVENRAPGVEWGY